MLATFKLRAVLRGHTGWVTQIVTNPLNQNMIMSSSRDKTILIWRIIAPDEPINYETNFETDNDTTYGLPSIRLYGHSHFISDLSVSACGNYALSGSWDKTLRLWDINTGKTTNRFEGHTKDVLSVDLSADNRHIVSGSRDKSIKLWNTLGRCKFTFEDDCHDDWVSCVRISPELSKPVIVSGGWDRMVKVWDMKHCKLSIDHYGHTSNLNSIAIGPDGSLFASAGRDGNIMLWNMFNEHHIQTVINKASSIAALSFSPLHFWIAVASGPSITIWDLNTYSIMDELCPGFLPYSSNTQLPECLSLTWSNDSKNLFAGYSDNLIRVWTSSSY